MAFMNYAGREICLKVVYFGPGLSGKTTNVEWLFARAAPDARGKLLSLKTESERTLFFDFLPLDLGTINGFKIRLQLYTVPGQIHYRASRHLIMRGADAIVFVADSQIARLEANAESHDDMEEGLREQGLDVSRLGYVVQYNKRDLPEVAEVAELRALVNPHGAPEVEAAAASGQGVVQTLRLASGLALQAFRDGGSR